MGFLPTLKAALATRQGVFLSSTPTAEVLKGCSLFWKRIYVFERFITEVGDDEELFGLSTVLFDNDILKVVENDASELRANLQDKIYYSLGKEKWDYLYSHADRIAVTCNLAKATESVIEQSARLDEQNDSLIKTIKTSVLEGIRKEWYGSLAESRIGDDWDKLPRKFRSEVEDNIKSHIELQFHHISNHSPPWEFSHLKYRNEVLLRQLSISSALHVEPNDFSYYAMKLNNFNLHDAERYLQGWRGLLPFVKRQALDAFTVEDIISIRKSRRWEKAMNRLEELCQKISWSHRSMKFTKDLQDSVISEYQEALGQEKASAGELGKQLTKGVGLTAISVIPIVGPLISTASGIVDPILSFILKENKQRNLAFFLNEIKRR